MQIAILIEPREGGGFRARAGEPFNASADGQTENEAASQLAARLRDRLQGSRVAFIDLGNGSLHLPQTPLQLDPLPDDDWFFKEMREAIEENRRKEDEADR